MGVLGNNIRLGSSAAGDYEVSKSLRYNNGDSPHMQRTLTETSNVQTFTYSCWFKVTGNFGGHRGAFIDAGTNGNNVFKCNIASDDKLYVLSTIGGQYKEHFRSDAYFRDPSAWMHLVLRCDSTQSTAANRVRVYINGTEISGTKTNHPDHFMSFYVNMNQWEGNNVAHEVGSCTQSSQYFSGNICEAHFIDGQSLTPASFAEANEDTGQWLPIKYSGTYESPTGTNPNDGTTWSGLFSVSSGGFDQGISNAFDGLIRQQTRARTANNAPTVTMDLSSNNIAVAAGSDHKIIVWAEPGYNSTCTVTISGTTYTSNTGGMHSFGGHSAGNLTQMTIVNNSGSGRTYLMGMAVNGYQLKDGSTAVHKAPNNSFFLNFKDNSGTTATTLGKDSSGLGNNFTPNNFSVAAGVGNDSLEDTPLNNFPTFNYYQSKAGSVVNGGLDVNYSDSDDNASNTATMGMRTGKWYYEITDRTDSSGTAAGIIGVCPDSYMETKRMVNGWPGFGSGSGIGFNGGDQHYLTGSNLGTYGGTWTTNDVIGVAVDADAGKIALSKNGQWADGAGNFDEAGITGGAQKSIPGDAPYFAVVSDTSGSHDPKFSINFGQRAFAHTPPAGYKKLCTKNLPEPTIKKSSDHFSIVTYTGTGSDKVISDVGFQADIAWIKNRTAGGNYHDLYDSLRGATKRIFPNEPDGEQTQSEGLKSFSSVGYTVGSNSDVGSNGADYVGWNWKESATAGIDIIQYTGNASSSGDNQTINHGLGVVPDIIMVKALTSPYSGGGHWTMYNKHLSNPTHYFLNLNKNVAEVTSSTSVFHQTAPTSTNFKVGYEFDTNKNGVTYMGYLFASVYGYSKFGKFVGNGNANGPFIYTGFRPAWVMLKRIDQASEWNIWDIKRERGEQPLAREIRANTSGTETSYQNPLRANDFLSNGFKMRTSDGDHNANNGTYVYMAFAEAPFKYSNAR